MVASGTNDGFAGWKRRMGVHEAYHQRWENRVLHWVCIPFELWAVVKLLSLVPLFASVDLAMLVIVLVAPVYLLTDMLMGAIMIAFLASCWWTTPFVLPDHALWGAGVAVAVFAVTFGAQVGIGHRIEGRDDTDKNLAELARTKNPIPILLVFYYHLVELFLAAGYRPTLAAAIRAHTEHELASIRGEGR